MGVDIHSYLIRRTTQGKFEDVILRNYKQEIIPFYNQRNYPLFTVLQNDDIYTYGDFPNHRFAVEISTPYVLHYFNETSTADGYYGFSYVNAASLMLYYLQYKKVQDIESEEYKQIDNPVKALIDRLQCYINLLFPDENPKVLYPDLYIVYWFDC